MSKTIIDANKKRLNAARKKSADAEKRLACLEKILDKFNPNLAKDLKRFAWQLEKKIPFFSVETQFQELREKYLAQNLPKNNQQGK